MNTKLRTEISFSVLAIVLVALGCQREPSARAIVKDQAVNQEPSHKNNVEPVGSLWFQEDSFLRQRDGIATLTCLLAQRNGMLLFEHYNQVEKESLQDIRSVTKSVLALLVGIALDQGHFQSTNDQVDQFLKQEIKFGNDVGTNLTLDHLLSMTDGFNYDESTEIGLLLRSRNPTRFLLNRKVVREPGSEFRYSSAACDLLSLVLSNATKIKTELFAESELFKPLNIREYSWDKSANGEVTGGYGLNLRPTDMLKFGELFYHRGAFDGKQVIDSQWLVRITQPRSFRTKKWGAISNLSYGQLWWTGEIEGEKVVFALGHGGQYLMLVPSLKLTLVSTARYTTGRVEADKAEQEISELLAYVIRKTKEN